MEKRLLILVGSYWPQLGGGELLNEKLANMSARCGWQVRVLTPAARGVTGNTIWRDGVEVRYVPAATLLGFPGIPLREIRAELDSFRPSVVELNGPNPHDIAAIDMARRRDVPSVVVYYADFRTDNVVSRLATTTYAALAARRATRVLTLTEDYAMRLEHRGVKRRQVRCLGIGVDTERFDMGASVSGASDVRLLFVGRLDRRHSYKRVDLLIRALAELQSAGTAPVLDIVGTGDLLREMQALADRLNVAGRVYFLGDLDESELVARYQRASALVLPSPSIAEGFGLVAAEAMACGIPVVTSIQAGASQLVRGSSIGALWNGRDISDLVRAIREVLLCADRPEIRRLAREYVRANFSWDALGLRLEDALDSAWRGVD